MNDAQRRPKSKRRHWLSRAPSPMEELMDDDLTRLLEEVETEFKASYEYHASRLKELKEALRARQEAERG